MDAYLDPRDDAIFMEIEKRLLLLISEGEDEVEDLFYAPLQTLQKEEKDSTLTIQATKTGFSDYHRSSPMDKPFVVHSSKPISGTGVFIPQCPSVASARANRDQKVLQQKKPSRGRSFNPESS